MHLPLLFLFLTPWKQVYWATNDFEQMRSQAMNPSQPFVYVINILFMNASKTGCSFANGDPTGYGYHAGQDIFIHLALTGTKCQCPIDFINGWDQGVLQKAVDNCHCNIYGDVSLPFPSCFRYLTHPSSHLAVRTKEFSI